VNVVGMRRTDAIDGSIGPLQGSGPARRRHVLEHADELLLPADRLRDLEPVDVVTLAELTRLIARALQELDLA
jgi:hypothetical protein